MVKIGENGHLEAWSPETWRLYLQNQKIGVCNHKTQLLIAITSTVSLKIKPVIQIYANVSDPSLPLNTPPLGLCYIHATLHLHHKSSLIPGPSRFDGCQCCRFLLLKVSFMFVGAQRYLARGGQQRMDKLGWILRKNKNH